MTDDCTHDKVHEDRILLSNPPQKNWICRKCGERGLDIVGDVHQQNDYQTLVDKFTAMHIEPSEFCRKVAEKLVADIDAVARALSDADVADKSLLDAVDDGYGAQPTGLSPYCATECTPDAHSKCCEYWKIGNGAAALKAWRERYTKGMADRKAVIEECAQKVESIKFGHALYPFGDYVRQTVAAAIRALENDDA